MNELARFVPNEGFKIFLVLFLSFLVGLEREEHKAASERYAFGGVRTFPLIGLIGYSLVLIARGSLVPVSVGFAVVGGFLWLSYQYKLSVQGVSGPSGVTTEISALVTYLVGALVSADLFWIATTITVISMFLLELKQGLEGLTKRIAGEEILTFTKFLLLTAVILPVLPNQPFTRFELNPFKTWLVVVAVSAISYGSYILLKVSRKKGGVIIVAVLGGLYSSTVATVALARRAAREQRPHLFAGGILMASGIMYLRLALLVTLFNRELGVMLTVPFLLLAGIACLVGWLWSRIADTAKGEIEREFEPKNPLEMRAALLFAGLFVGIIIVTHLVVQYMGKGGVYGLAAIMGVTDVDPFILGMTQSAGRQTGLMLAANSILIAAASNNLIKGIYARAFADHKTGMQSLMLLGGLTVLGLLPVLWFAVR